MPSSLSSLFSWLPILIWSLCSPMLGDWKQGQVWMLSVMTGVTGENDKAMKDNLVLMSLQFTLCKPGLCALCYVHCKCELDRWQGTWTIIFLTIQGIWDRFKVFIFCRTFSTDGWITLRDQIIPRIVVNWPCCDLSFWVRGWVLGPSSGLRLCQLTRVQPGNWALS